MDDQSKQYLPNTNDDSQKRSSSDPVTPNIVTPTIPVETSINGLSDNIGGYKIKAMADYMGNGQSSIPQHNNLGKPTQPTTELNPNTLIDTQQKTNNTKPLVIALLILIVIVCVALAIHNHRIKAENKNKSNTNSFTQTNINDTNKALQNPLNTPSQVNSQIKYCTSSPLAADVAC